MKLRLDLFAKSALLFSLAQLVGIYSAYRYSLKPLIEKTNLQLHFSTGDILLSVIIISLFFVILTRFHRIAGYAFRIFLILIIFFGTQAVLAPMLNPPLNNLLPFTVLIAFLLIPSVLVQDLAVILAISGISVLFGMSIVPAIAAILLVVLSVYDIIAIYKTKHMVAMAKEMISAGAIFGFIIPAHWRDFLSVKHQVELGENFMILGSGDVGMPLILSAAVALSSPSQALVIAAFSLAGLFMTHILFVTQSGKRQPMAALPPIATMTVIGYLATILFK